MPPSCLPHLKPKAPLLPRPSIAPQVRSPAHRPHLVERRYSPAEPRSMPRDPRPSRHRSPAQVAVESTRHPTLHRPPRAHLNFPPHLPATPTATAPALSPSWMHPHPQPAHPPSALQPSPPSSPRAPVSAPTPSRHPSTVSQLSQADSPSTTHPSSSRAPPSASPSPGPGLAHRETTRLWRSAASPPDLPAMRLLGRD